MILKFIFLKVSTTSLGYAFQIAAYSDSKQLVFRLLGGAAP